MAIFNGRTAAMNLKSKTNPLNHWLVVTFRKSEKSHVASMFVC